LLFKGYPAINLVLLEYERYSAVSGIAVGGAGICDYDTAHAMFTMMVLSGDCIITPAFSKPKEQIRDVAAATHGVFSVNQRQREMCWLSNGDSNRQK
jgi:hypothetical protein